MSATQSPSERQLEYLKIAASLTCEGCEDGQPIEEIVGYPSHRKSLIVCRFHAKKWLPLFKLIEAEARAEEHVADCDIPQPCSRIIELRATTEAARKACSK